MLLYPGAGTETMDGYNIKATQNGVEVTTLSAKDFGGEHNIQSWLYVLVMWLVSIWAAVTNLAQAFFIKVFKKKKSSLGKILWEMGRDPKHISSSFGDRFSQINRQTISGAASWRSLDIFYNYHEKIKSQLNNNFEGRITRYWIGKIENRQAVTNRLKIVVNLLTKAFAKFINEPEVRIVSIASGSAQAVIEAMLRCPHLNIKAILIDVDKTALKAAKTMAEKNGLGERFSFVRGTTKSLERVCREFQPHIIEMVGFLDYRPDDKAIQLIGEIKRYLPSGGIFLTCNINKNREKIFLDWVLLWPMIYRNEKQFANLLLEGGFSSENINILYEPFRIHGIGVCRK
ncbi:MAG: class I SAM-dependent methyltransferase family protein [Patescibacteria group bacterium]|nr:class I SAM-dependent methyltransferase family protein [Patescibacteria group bacterium]